MILHYQPSIFDGWYFFTQNWRCDAEWIVQIRIANITARKKKHIILRVWIFLAVAIVQKDIVKNTFGRKESRCDMSEAVRKMIEHENKINDLENALKEAERRINHESYRIPRTKFCICGWRLR